MWLGRGILCAGLLCVAAGCVTQDTHQQVVAERDYLATQRRDLEGRVERLEATNQSLSNERLALIDESETLRVVKNQLEADLTRLSRTGAELAESLQSSQALLAVRTAEISKMRSTYDSLLSELEDEVASGQIQIERLRSGLRMNLSQDILFASGSARLSAQGAEVLRKVGERLIALPNTIEVLGYTDDVPIGRRYPSNWELAAARASSVVRLLAEVGVDPTKLRVVSRGEFAPVAPNDTAEGRALNRRIEIRLASAGSSSADSPDKVEESSAAPPAPPVTQPTIEEPAVTNEPAEAAIEEPAATSEPAEPTIDEPEVEALAPSEAERVSAP